MKTYKFTITLLFLILLSNGCDDIVNVEPQSSITSSNMWQNQEQVRSGVTGLHDSFRNNINGRSFLYWFEHRSGNWQYGLSGGGLGTETWGQLFNNTLDASTAPGTDWGEWYRTINTSNLALKYIPDIVFTNNDEKNRLLSQVYFIRAYAYYALARIYGDVPLVLNPFESVEDENLYPVRSPIQDVFEQIKSDIDAGLDLVPNNATMDRIKPSEAALLMLQTDVYLWSAKRLNGGGQDLDVADQAVDRVLGNSNYSLMDNYEQVFRTKQNNEIIYSIYFAIGEQENHYGNQFIIPQNDVPSQFQNNPVLVQSGQQWMNFTDFYIENYLMRHNDDSRMDINYQVFESGNFNFNWINKFQGEYRDGNRFFTDHTPVYRYAEAILFKAEILNGKGNSSGAINYLNQIAQRAYGVDNYYSTMSQLEVDDAILDERLIEFGAEGKSWFDIVRFGQAFSRVPSLIGREGDNQGNVLLFPVDPVTISRNPNITQTPGY